MASDIVTALKAVLDRLGELAAGDADLRERLRALARATLDAAQESQPPQKVEPPPKPTEPPPVPTPIVAERPLPLPPPERPPPQPPPPLPPPPLADLTEVAARCRLKAEAARRMQARRTVPAKPVEPTADRDLIDRARALPDCSLWMLHESPPSIAGPSDYANLAGCFDAVADAADLLRSLEAYPEAFAPSIALAAEAQSGLRIASLRLGHRNDAEQIRMYVWLKETGAAKRHYIHRYMRIEDTADPANSAAVRDRMRTLREDLRGSHDRVRNQAKLLNKLKYLARRVESSSEPGDDWARLIEVADELVLNGVPPSNVEIREQVLPLLERMPIPADPPEGFARVLREMERYLELREEEEAAKPLIPVPLSEEVRRVAELLHGRAAILIGGVRRPHADEDLTRALGLSELIWLEGTHRSHFDFEPFVARPDVAVVVLAIRWSSHGFEKVKEFCEKYGKPMVRLPGGYSPNSVAHHILAQTSGKLGSE